jgi:hypothetical protein
VTNAVHQLRDGYRVDRGDVAADQRQHELSGVLVPAPVIDQHRSVEHERISHGRTAATSADERPRHSGRSSHPPKPAKTRATRCAAVSRRCSAGVRSRGFARGRPRAAAFFLPLPRGCAGRLADPLERGGEARSDLRTISNSMGCPRATRGPCPERSRHRRRLRGRPCRDHIIASALLGRSRQPARCIP